MDQYPNQDFNQQQQQQPYQPPTPQNFEGKGLCIAGLVLGIVSLAAGFTRVVGIILGLVAGIVGVVCAAVGRKKAKAQGIKSGIGTAGYVCSIIGIVLCALAFLSALVLLSLSLDQLLQLLLITGG